ncbi:MAG: T9SS type A sorting domain-containing protein, partial [Chitinophagales bacterium]|nr:T9SS type A sorting domain-containing protein [Chitinophagales bacterium]
WSLTGTVNALLRTYLDCEAVLLNTNKLESQFIPMDVYPNPVSNWINVQFKLDTPVSRLELRLVNVNGQTVHQHTYGYAGRGDFRESYFIPESVQPGFYLLELVSEEKIIGRVKISVQ